MDKYRYTLLEDELSYWKSHISVRDVLTSELAYSLIYDNIHPGKVDKALSTVNLTALPNRFFLVQVDDYLNQASKMPITQEFHQKSALVHRLQDYMDHHDIPGFSANMIGLDKLIVFICCSKEQCENNEYLTEIAEAFKRIIRQKSSYTISICISKVCHRITQFSEMYPQMDLALSKSYFSGKEFTIHLEDVIIPTRPSDSSAALNSLYPEFLVSIVRQNAEQFDQVIQKIIRTFLETQVQPRKAQLELLRLLQKAEDYVLHLGVHEQDIIRIHEETMTGVLSCTFIADVRIHLHKYFEQLSRILEEYSRHSIFIFRLLVEEYVAANYQNIIRLGTLANLMGFSEGHFARKFHQEFGVTFIHYLNDYRIRQSCRLLAETLISIEQIAYQVGINNYSYFCTCFKTAMGVSPGVYRRKCASERNQSELQ